MHDLIFLYNSILTCAVGQPVIGVPGDRHFAMLKNTRYFLSSRPESTPQRRPFESIGAKSFSTLPRVIPKYDYIKNKKKI